MHPSRGSVLAAYVHRQHAVQKELRLPSWSLAFKMQAMGMGSAGVKWMLFLTTESRAPAALATSCRPSAQGQVTQPEGASKDAATEKL